MTDGVKGLRVASQVNMYVVYSLIALDGHSIEEEWEPGPFGIPRVGDLLWSPWEYDDGREDVEYEVVRVRWATSMKHVYIEAKEIEPS